MPVRAAGRRVLAPASVESDSGPMPAATATADPPLEPPGVSRVSQGLRVTPNSGASVSSLCANSDVVVLPTMIAPAFLSRSTATASASGTLSAIRREPQVVRSPAVLMMSFTDTGTPCSAPSTSPRATAASACCAAFIALSRSTVMKAFRVGCVSSMRRRTSAVTSADDTWRVLMRSRRSTAEVNRLACFVMTGGSREDERVKRRRKRRNREAGVVEDVWTWPALSPRRITPAGTGRSAPAGCRRRSGAPPA